MPEQDDLLNSLEKFSSNLKLDIKRLESISVDTIDALSGVRRSVQNNTKPLKDLSSEISPIIIELKSLLSTLSNIPDEIKPSSRPVKDEDIERISSAVTISIDTFLKSFSDQIDSKEITALKDSLSDISSDLQNLKGILDESYKDFDLKMVSQLKKLQQGTGTFLSHLNNSSDIDFRQLFIQQAEKKLTKMSRLLIFFVFGASLVGLVSGFTLGSVFAEEKVNYEQQVLFGEYYEDFNLLRSYGIKTSLVQDTHGRLYIRVTGIRGADEGKKVSHGIYDIKIRK